METTSWKTVKWGDVKRSQWLDQPCQSSNKNTKAAFHSSLKVQLCKVLKLFSVITSMFEHLAEVAAALPVPTSSPNTTWLGRSIYLLHHTSQTFLVSVIVILKQFIIKYEHFVQGQVHFTKKKSYNKSCWSLIYNMNYGLKSCLYKSQIYKKKTKISSGLAVALLKFSGWSLSPKSYPLP